MGLFGSVTGRGKPARTLVHLGMLLAALAFASWWTSHTILDTARTRRVTDAVIGSTEVRHYLAQAIAPAVTQAVGASNVNAAAHAAGTATSPSPADALSQRLGAVLDRPDIRVKLEQFVVDAHELLIGQSTRPAVLDQQTVITLVHAALPSMSLADLARIPPVRVSVPRFGALSTGRRAFQNRTWLYALGAIVLLALAIATTKDRHGTIKLIGKWLLGISVAHLLVLWLIPVVVAPQVSKSPWVSLVASLARALNAGIVTGLIVLVVAGVACLLVDVFVPATTDAGAPLPSGANLEP